MLHNWRHFSHILPNLVLRSRLWCQSETEILWINSNLNFSFYNSFLSIRISLLQRKCKYKGCGSHFGPYSSRKNPLALLFGFCLIWLTNRSHPGQCYTGSSLVSIYPSATADELNLECLLPLCSQFVLCPSLCCRLWHAYVSPLFYPLAVLFVSVLWGFVQCFSLGAP